MKLVIAESERHQRVPIGGSCGTPSALNTFMKCYGTQIVPEFQKYAPFETGCASNCVMPTIVPITSEAEWLSRLGEVPDWDPPRVPTLVLAPHPDDETLGAGGLIARLCSLDVPVTVVAITDGENAYADRPDLGDVRRQEQTEALHRLGVPTSMIHRLGLPDRDVSVFEDRLVEALLQLLGPGMHIVAPWQRDFHPDHEAAGRAAARVVKVNPVVVSYYLFWTWHRGTPDLFDGSRLGRLPLTARELKTKVYALEAHASQFDHPDGQPILSPELLMPAHRPYEVYVR